jgi:phosphoglycerate kinase
MPNDLIGLDIGPESVKLFDKRIKESKTVIWNGPMGAFEMPNFAAGTNGILKSITDSGCLSIVGGGDSVSAVNKSGMADKISYISTGGGAWLELLEGKTLPGIAALDT